jgi:transposase
MANTFTLGVDPAKENFAVCLLGADGSALDIPHEYPATRPGFSALLGALRSRLKQGDHLVVGIEATAALDDNLLAWLQGLKEPFTVRSIRPNPAVVARFTQARPTRDKTDRADARRIAQFTRFYAGQLESFEHDPEAQAMSRLVNERSGLVREMTALKNRLQDRLVIAFPEFTQVFPCPCEELALRVLRAAPTAPIAVKKKAATLSAIRTEGGRHALGLVRARRLIDLARTSIASATEDSDASCIVFLIDHLRLLRARVQEIENQIDRYVAQRPAPDPARAAHPLASIPAQIAHLGAIRGVGVAGAATIVLRSQGLLRFPSAKAFCAQVGSCPERRQTGSSMDKARLTPRGDRRARTMLCLLTRMMTLYDPALAFHKWRLKKKGLRPQQAICACMNRLARIMWAVVHHGLPYDPQRAILNARRHHPHLWNDFVRESREDGKLWKNLEHLRAQAA